MPDTIAAVATAEGTAGVAIVRVSGSEAEAILRAAFRPAKGFGKAVRDRHFYYGRVVDAGGEPLDEAMAVLMRAPRSYTREDVCEIHCHGGKAAVRAALGRVIEAGAREAEPGEFTKRAFLNGRIDLAQAEAVMRVIAASGEGAERAAVRQLEGGASAFAKSCRDEAKAMLAAIEAAVDFPEEIEEQETREELSLRLEALAEKLAEGYDERGARILREGARVVIAGKPNVGKSSLMNALLKSDRAIVAERAGTTRDVLTERMTISGMSAELCDTAGQREADDPVEREGVARARRAEESADLVLAVFDASAPLCALDFEVLERADGRFLIVFNKWDEKSDAFRPEIEGLRVSAKTGMGIDTLIAEMTRRLGGAEEADMRLTEARHIRLAASARESALRAREALEFGYPLDACAVDLWDSARCLGEITGEDVGEGVIDEIFSKFCVGK